MGTGDETNPAADSLGSWRPTRRNAIYAAGGALAAVAGVVGAPAVMARGQDDRVPDRSVVGTWRVTVTPDGGLPAFNMILNLAPGGGLVETNRQSPLPGIGMWAMTGTNDFKWRLSAYLTDKAGNPAGRVESTVVCKLDQGRDSWTGRSHAIVYGANDAVAATIDNTLVATRMRFE